MVTEILKRDGRRVSYDEAKIVNAIARAMKASGHESDEEAARLGDAVDAVINEKYPDQVPNVEQIQDAVEVALMRAGFEDVAKSYILYRADRTTAREKNSQLMHIFDEITSRDSKESDLKRDNANVDGDSAMGTMLQTARPRRRSTTRSSSSAPSRPAPTAKAGSTSTTSTSTRSR